MVAVVQLVEHLVVVQDVAGSSPVSHPNAPALRRRGFLLQYACVGLRVKMCVWLGVSRGLDLAFLNAD